MYDRRDINTRKRELLREYIELVLSSLIPSVIDAAIEQQGKEINLKSTSFMAQYIPEIKIAIADSFKDKFTVMELEAMLAFYKTPEGKSYAKKMPPSRNVLFGIINDVTKVRIKGYRGH